MLRDGMGWRPWTALIVPSGRDSEVDQMLSDSEFLRQIIGRNPEAPGLVLQLDEPIGREIDLCAPFPAFKKALARQSEWPGLLLWSGNNSVFLSRGRSSEQRADFIKRTISRLFSRSMRFHPGAHVSVDMLVRIAGFQVIRGSWEPAESDFHIIQASDIHMGNPRANERMARLRNLIQKFGDEYGRRSNVLPVLSGDIIDTPSSANFSSALSFRNEIKGQFTNAPFYVRGNHDCRKTVMAVRRG